MRDNDTERFVEPKERLPFNQKLVEKLVLKMNKALKDVTEMIEQSVDPYQYYTELSVHLGR